MVHQSVLFCCLVVYVASAPTDVVPLEKQQPTVIPIVSQSEELEPNGTYKFSYETGNGIKREETSYTKIVPRAQGRSAGSNEGGENDESDEIYVQRGSYSYTAPDGTVISVRYIADENGFQPIGDHIPQAISLAASANSAEKSGRALNIKDSADAASAPVAIARAAPPAENKPAEPEEVKVAASESESVQPADAQSSEAANTPATAVSEVSNSEASTTAAVEASTAAASNESSTALTSEAASEAGTEAASEAASTAAATEANSTPEAASPTEEASTPAA